MASETIITISYGFSCDQNAVESANSKLGTSSKMVSSSGTVSQAGILGPAGLRDTTITPVRAPLNVKELNSGFQVQDTPRSKFGMKTYSKTKVTEQEPEEDVEVVEVVKKTESTAVTTSMQTDQPKQLRTRKKKVVEDMDYEISDESDSEDNSRRRRQPRRRKSVASRVIEKSRGRLSDTVEVIIPDVLSISRKRGKMQQLIATGENKGGSRARVKLKSSKCQVFFCDKCDKVYDQYSELVYHERRHTGEKPFQCTWPGCKKAFSASNARVRHLRTHTGEKPYVCPVQECGRRFTYWKDLKLHKYRHTGEKPHRCDWDGCNSKFFRKDDLKHHRYTHTGEKPYKCPWPGCGAAFSQKSPLNLHVKKTHKSEMPPKLYDSEKSITSGELDPTAAAVSGAGIPAEGVTTSYAGANTPVPVTSEDISYSQASSSNSNCYPVSDNVLLNGPVFQTPETLPVTQGYPLACENSFTTASTTTSWNNSSSYISDATIPVTPAQDVISTARSRSCSYAATTPKSCQGTTTLPASAIKPAVTTLSPVTVHHRVSSANVQTSIKNVDNNNFRTYSKLPRSTEPLEPPAGASGDVTDSVSSQNSDQTTGKEIETVTIDDENDHTGFTPKKILVVKPIKQRANYRLKIHPEGNSARGNVTRIASRKQQVKVGEAVGLKRSSKRTIAVQTVKRSLKKSLKGGVHECDICQRIFKAKHDRDCHRMTHTGEKPRACDWPNCNYRCITKSKLIRHKRKHTGEKNYACDWPDCGKKFATSRHMKEHRRSHTGEKPFRCDWPGCDKWFSRKDHIKNHRYTHTGEKPRKCPFPGCEAAFIQLSPLKKHMELHKRDGANVPNRTRKRKQPSQTSPDASVDSSKVNGELQHDPNIVFRTPTGSLPNIVPHARIPSNHGGIPTYGVVNPQDSCCMTGYENSNQPGIHLDYDMMLRPNYC